MFEGLLLYSFIIGLIVICAFLGLIFGAISFAKVNTACPEFHQQLTVEQASTTVATLTSTSPVSSCAIYIWIDEETIVDPTTLFFVNSDGDTQPAFVVTLSPVSRLELRVTINRLCQENQACFGGVVIKGTEQFMFHALCRKSITVT